MYMYMCYVPQLLQSHSLDQLHSLWSEVSSQSVCRQHYVHVLDQTLSSVEERRHQMVSKSVVLSMQICST